MKILYIAEGLDRPESAIIQRMAQSGHDVSLILPPQWDIDPLVAAAVDVHRAPLSGRRDRATIRAIRSCISDKRIELVHGLRNNRPLSNALVATRGINIPVVAYRGTVGHLSRWNPGAWLTYLHPRIACITCVSEAVRTYLIQQGVPGSRVRTIHKGHDPSWYTPDTHADLSAHDIPKDAVIVCCAAHLRPVKGIDILIQALHHIPATLKLHLLLVGENSDDRLEKMADHPDLRGRVHFAGFQTNAPAWIAASDIFVMPSIRREGLPRAVIEAMSMGIAPIVSDVGGMPELVEDGCSGKVVPPSDPAALAGAIVRVAEDPDLRTRLGAGAQARIEGPFSIDRTVALLQECYNTL